VLRSSRGAVNLDKVRGYTITLEKDVKYFTGYSTKSKKPLESFEINRITNKAKPTGQIDPSKSKVRGRNLYRKIRPGTHVIEEENGNRRAITVRKGQ
jgi:hypothetical protein